MPRVSKNFTEESATYHLVVWNSDWWLERMSKTDVASSLSYDRVAGPHECANNNATGKEWKYRHRLYSNGVHTHFVHGEFV